MSGLIYKNFIQNRKIILLVTITVLAFSEALFMKTPDGMESIRTLILLFSYIFIYVITGGVFQTSLFEADENKKWAYYVASSPQTVRGQVASKYYFSLIISLIVTLWCFITDALSISINKGTASLATFIVLLFYIQLLMRAIEIPFIVRFGSKVGNSYHAMIFLVIIFIAFVYLLFGDLSHFGSLDEFYDWFFKFINGGGTKILINIFAVLPYVSVFLYWLSYKVSCKFYLKGVDNYDK